MKRIWLIAAVLLTALALIAGGTGKADINRMVFVTGIGIDRSGEQFRYTFYVAVPTGSDSAVSDNNVEYESVTLEAASMAEALRSMEINSSRDISLEHLNCVALGSSSVQENIPALLDYLTRNPTVRRQCTLLALDCSAKDFFSAEYRGSIASGAAAMLERQDDSGSRSSIMTLGKLAGTAKEPMGFCLYVLDIADGEEPASPSDVSKPAQLEITGLAVYRADGYGGTIDRRDAELARLFTPRQNSGILTAIDEDGNSYHYEITYSKCRTAFYPGDSIRADLNITAECLLIDTGGSPSSPPDEKELSDSLHRQLMDILDLSRIYGSAMVGLEKEAGQSSRLWFRQKRTEWDTLYRTAQLELNVECIIEHRSS